jgi:hypothetical protein
MCEPIESVRVGFTGTTVRMLLEVVATGVVETRNPVLYTKVTESSEDATVDDALEDIRVELGMVEACDEVGTVDEAFVELWTVDDPLPARAVDDAVGTEDDS